MSDLNRLKELAGMPREEQVNEMDVRKVTNSLHEMMDEGILDPRQVADAALKYMSEDEVKDMAYRNELLPADDFHQDDLQRRKSDFDNQPDKY